MEASLESPPLLVAIVVGNGVDNVMMKGSSLGDDVADEFEKKDLFYGGNPRGGATFLLS
jgi:hypothetical protein